jgi:hypothetical protein
MLNNKLPHEVQTDEITQEHSHIKLKFVCRKRRKCWNYRVQSSSSFNDNKQLHRLI